MAAQLNRDIFEIWLTLEQTSVGNHTLSVLVQKKGAGGGLFKQLRAIVQDHYVDPQITAERVKALGASQTAALLREHLPRKKTARSGDLGEILATEIAERYLGYRVPVRRLRWKDGRDMALRGDDIIAVKHDVNQRLQFLKGESKSRLALTADVIKEAAVALDRDRGRPSRHSALFVAERIRDQGDHALALEIDEAVLHSFRSHKVEHLLFTLAGNDPAHLLQKHLRACMKKKRRRYAIGLYVKNHSTFINKSFTGLQRELM